MADKTYELNFKLSDGTNKTVEFTAPQGDTGQRGTGLLAVTTGPSSYTTAVGGITPKYRMSISTIKTQSGATEVLLGDTVRYSYYHYPIAYLDASYAYFTTRVSIRGASGAAGADGADGKSAYAYAQDAGYTGTEAEFAAKLAEEYPPPDWQAAEGEPGHILNRTHWRDVTETVLFEQAITVANNQFLDASGVSIPLNAGETYTVVWDGVSYKTVAKDMVYNGFDAVAVGNGAFTGAGDTGEPFLILTLEGAGYGVVCLTDGEHTFTVSGNKYTYHPIPPEYLAGSKPFYIDLKTGPDNEILYETDITVNEVSNALSSGYQVVVRRKLVNKNYYDFFFMEDQGPYKDLNFYRIQNLSGRPECELLEFTPNNDGGYDITYSNQEIANPTALKNPYALTINGTSYDGSQAVDLTEAVNNMIVAKLNAMTHAEEVAF